MKGISETFLVFHSVKLELRCDLNSFLLIYIIPVCKCSELGTSLIYLPFINNAPEHALVKEVIKEASFFRFGEFNQALVISVLCKH